MIINLKSDTQTLPSASMLKAIGKAELGDDVYSSDPTVNLLEKKAAEIMRKESAMLAPTGTMANLCALMAHTERGDEVIMEAESHIYYYEVGGFSLANLSPRLIPGTNGIMSIEDVKNSLRKKNIHYPDTSLLCIENTHNRGGGTVSSLKLTQDLCNLAHSNGLKVHIDGARIFNAAISLKVKCYELVEPADSVMFCLSKGLSCPVGSMLVGTEKFIKKARKIRKLLGGGMRQSGIVAAPGIVALDEMIGRLEIDHQNAKILAEGLKQVPGIYLDLSTVQTNIVQFNIAGLGLSSDEFAKEVLEEGLIVSTRPPHNIRAVTHRHISSSDIEKAIDLIKKTSQKLRNNKKGEKEI